MSLTKFGDIELQLHSLIYISYFYLFFATPQETWEPLAPISPACNPYYEYQSAMALVVQAADD
jgi:hypothetical protein